jgi:hypothetical protein
MAMGRNFEVISDIIHAGECLLVAITHRNGFVNCTIIIIIIEIINLCFLLASAYELKHLDDESILSSYQNVLLMN